LKVGILAAGYPPRSLQPVFGDYVGMFKALLDGRGYDWRTYDVAHGFYPDAVEDCEAYLLTGASAGVYDGDPWIDALLEFLRQAKGRAKLVGVCFGHQAMAQAFGGEVIKWPDGRGVGLQTYEVADAQPWMDPPPAIALPASHQDQVAVLPPAARVLAGNDFCRNGMLAYDDQPALSLQLHPEFDPAFAAALIRSRLEGDLPDAAAVDALESLTRPNDCARVGRWIEDFLAS
jgi:GMP synthase-like glutamine amidotransferase